MKRLISVLSLVLLLAMLLTACFPAVPVVTTPSSTSASSTSSSTTTDDTGSTEEPDEKKGVMINEVVGKNYGHKASDGGIYDWIELYNHSSSTADISGWMLSNDPDDPVKYVFPQGTRISPYGYLIIWAVGKDVTPTAQGHYAPFKVSSSGETVVLTTSEWVLRDSVEVPMVDGGGKEWSYARIADGGYTWGICTATPRSGNEGSLVQLPSGLFSLSQDSGFYEEAFDLTFTVSEGYTLKYTTDCSDPVSSRTATVWSGESVRVYDPSSDPVRYANYNTQNADGRYMWAPDQIDKCFVLRVAVVDEEGVASPVSTHCYFVGFDQKEGYSGLPVVCLTSDPNGLYSKNGGLLVLNNGESSWSASTHDTRDWERQTNFAMFSADGEYLFDQEVGIKVRGTSTRSMTQKSLNVYARAEYGDKEFSSEVFGERTRSIILRNDFVNLHHLGQGYLQDLIADRDVLTQSSYPVLVFLEGEFYGLYMLYERFSENFVEDRYGIADDNIWTAKKFAGNWGAEYDAPTPESLLACQQDLNDILAYIRDHDMSQKVHYDYVCSRIDMDSLIDLLCFQLYIGNVDFSLAQNISAWRAIEPDPANPYADGRWRFVVYDLDISMICAFKGMSYDVNSNPFKDDQPFAGPGFLGFDIAACYYKLSGDTLVKDMNRQIRYDFAVKMMKSPAFCEQFVRTMEDMGNVNFAPDRVKAALDAQLALIAPVYATYRKRVIQAAYENTDPDVDEQLLANLMGKYEQSVDYFNRRFEVMSRHLADAFGLTGTRNTVKLSVRGASEAQIRVNTTVATATAEGLDMQYYSDYALTLTAPETSDGFAFDRWEISGGVPTGSLTDPTVRISLSKDSTLRVTAVYVPAGK